MNECVEVEYGNRRESPSSINDCRYENESRSSDASADHYFNDVVESDVLTAFRLSLVGLGSSARWLSSSRSSKSSEEHRDELHSTRYSSVVETVRHSLIECLPQISEEMVSRAIINAFADSNLDKRTRAHDEIEVIHQDWCQDEVDIIWKTFDFWQRRTGDKEGKDKNGTRNLLQSILDATFLKIQREELTSVDTPKIVRTMSAVLSVLRLTVSAYNPIDSLADTIILKGIPKHMTRAVLFRELSRFGRVKSVAIASQNASFGLCRFCDETSAMNALDNQHSFHIGGVNPILTTLSMPTAKEAGSKSSGRLAHLWQGRISDR